MTSTNQNICIDISSDEEDEKKPVYTTNRLAEDEKKPKITSPTLDNDDDDDDCVVLDYDPYKTMDKDAEIESGGNDEVLVVGQKGEIACRDFPHPRHDCAKFPFKSTPHQEYCEMCHCYVCDIPAPCIHWCNGIATDHCHANNKEHIWKNQRECTRTRKINSKRVSTTRVQQIVSQPQSIRPCFDIHPNKYIRTGYGTEQRKMLQTPHQLFPTNPTAGNYQLNPMTASYQLNPKAGGYQVNPTAASYQLNPTAASYQHNPTAGRYQLNPKGGTIIYQNSQYTCNTPPTALQGNQQQQQQQRVFSTLQSQNKVYARQFGQNMYSANNVQTTVVPPKTPHPPAVKQQPGKSINDKLLSEFEDWLMDKDNSTPTNPVFPVPDQDYATRSLPHDWKALFDDLDV